MKEDIKVLDLGIRSHGQVRYHNMIPGPNVTSNNAQPHEEQGYIYPKKYDTLKSLFNSKPTIIVPEGFGRDISINTTGCILY